jgi:hypothetical protein
MGKTASIIVFDEQKKSTGIGLSQSCIKRLRVRFNEACATQGQMTKPEFKAFLKTSGFAAEKVNSPLTAALRPARLRKARLLGFLPVHEHCLLRDWGFCL